MGRNRITGIYLDTETVERLTRLKGRRKGCTTPINVSAVCREAIGRALDAIENPLSVRDALSSLADVWLTDGTAVRQADGLLRTLPDERLDCSCRVTDDTLTFTAPDGAAVTWWPW